MAGVYFGSFLPAIGVGGEGAPGGTGVGAELRGGCRRERGPRGAGRGHPEPAGSRLAAAGPRCSRRLKVTAKIQHSPPSPLPRERGAC